MEPFSISRLETDVGLMRVEGAFDPIAETIKIDELAMLGTDGWVDITFWLTEQSHEQRLETVIQAIRSYLQA